MENSVRNVAEKAIVVAKFVEKRFESLLKKRCRTINNKLIMDELQIDISQSRTFFRKKFGGGEIYLFL